MAETIEKKSRVQTIDLTKPLSYTPGKLAQIYPIDRRNREMVKRILKVIYHYHLQGFKEIKLAI